MRHREWVMFHKEVLHVEQQSLCKNGGRPEHEQLGLNDRAQNGGSWKARERVLQFSSFPDETSRERPPL